MAKILVVDDEVSILNMVQRLLREEDYEITACTSVEEGRLADSREKFTLVITDNSAPVLNAGRDWALELAAIGRKVILMSAFNVDNVEPLKVLSKPFQPLQTLLDRIREELDKGERDEDSVRGGR